MKKTLRQIFGFLAMLLVCSAMALRAQDTSLSNVTVDATNATLQSVLTELEKQSGCSFVYSSEDIDLARRVTLKMNDVPLRTALNTLFKTSGETFAINGRMVSIFKQAADNKMKIISGIVADGQGEPMVGVTVRAASGAFAVTDRDGKYSISARLGEKVTFSMIGMRDYEIIVGKDDLVDISMAVDVMMLEETIIVGYGTQRKIISTGSVTTTTGDKLQQSSSVNLSQSLAGRMSGVIVNSRSGEPGNDDAIMLIRGRSSLGNNNPLIIIDGVQGRDDEFSRLSGDEIESVTVLKDASAAIYGARSANGVILVTTKRGAKSTAPKINFSYDLGLQSPTRLVEMADAVLYTTAWNAALDIDKAPHKYSDDQIGHYRTQDDPIRYPNTNWYEAIIKPVSLQHKYGVTVNGGTDRVSYFISFNGQNQDGLFRKSATKYQQLSLRSNIDVQVTKNFKIGIDISGRQQQKNYSAFPSDSYGIFYITQRRLPTSQPHYPNGLVTGGDNPEVMVTNTTGYNNTTSYNLNSTISAKWELPYVTKGLSIEGKVAYDIFNLFNKVWKTPWTYYEYEDLTETYLEKTYQGWASPSLSEKYNCHTNLSINAQINYDRTFADKYHVYALAGFEQTKYRSDFFNTGRGRYASDALDELFAGSADKEYFTNNGYAIETARRSFFGRVGFDYAEKYMIQSIVRFDGSENFPKDRRWGIFPSVSAGWRFSEEPWIKDNADWINNLKLRLSWGKQGNDRIAAFQYMTTYMYAAATSTKYQYELDGTAINAILLGASPNPNITWEVATSWNAGFDGTILNGALGWEIEYFHTRRENILCKRNASIPKYTGLANLPDENIGIVQNQGVEVQLRHEGYNANRSLFYQISGNFMYARNKIIYMDETPWGEGYERMNLTGHPMGSRLYYRTLGVFKTQEELDSYPHLKGATLGDLKYEDLDGDGEITSMDRERLDLTATPQIVFGLNFALQWKSLDFMMLFQGQALARYYYSPLCDPVSGNIDAVTARNAWTLENTNSDYPRIASTYSNGGVYRNTLYYRNAAFLRLKNIELGYTFDQPVLKQKAHVQSIRLYVGGYNVFTIDGLKVVDPETSDESYQTYPQMRIFNIGAKMTF